MHARAQLCSSAVIGMVQHRSYTSGAESWHCEPADRGVNLTESQVKAGKMIRI